MNNRRKRTREIQISLINEHRRQLFQQEITNASACWIPIICTCLIILSKPKGSIPFLQWTIKGETMSLLALVILLPWGLYQITHGYSKKPIDQWLLNLLPCESILWLICFRIQHNKAIAFLQIGILGATLCVFTQKTNRKRYAAVVMMIALLIPACCATLKMVADISTMYQKLYSSVMNKDENKDENEFFESSTPKCNDEEWEVLSLQDKVGFLKKIVEYETAYMGIPNILICIEELSIDNQTRVLGQYSSIRNEILIDLTHLEETSYWSCLNTILHECRHAMQRHVVDRLLDWEDEAVQTHAYYENARQWKESFENGNDGTIEGYYFDPIEADARSYAEERMSVYYNFSEY